VVKSEAVWREPSNLYRLEMASVVCFVGVTGDSNFGSVSIRVLEAGGWRLEAGFGKELPRPVFRDLRPVNGWGSGAHR